MKIIFLTQDKKLDRDSDTIINTIKKAGHKVIVLNTKGMDGKTFNEQILDADMVVARLGSLNFGLGYQIAHISHKRKFSLCFYPESMNQKLNPKNFVGIKYAKYLRLVAYNKSNLGDLVKRNLNYSKKQSMRRFNFFIPREIEEYLEWTLSRRKRKRSDFLRSLVYDAISKDKSYNAFLKKTPKRRNKKQESKIKN